MLVPDTALSVDSRRNGAADSTSTMMMRFWRQRTEPPNASVRPASLSLTRRVVASDSARCRSSNEAVMTIPRWRFRPMQRARTITWPGSLFSSRDTASMSVR